MGLDDIKNKVARTPLKPIETFSFDPSRLLRTIRISNKLNLQILPEIFEVALDPKLQVNNLICL